MSATSDDPAWRDRTLRRFFLLLCAVSSLLVLTEIAALRGIVPHLAPLSLHALFTNSLFAIGFGCPLVLQLSRWPVLREWLITIVAAVVATAIVAAIVHRGPQPPPPPCVDAVAMSADVRTDACTPPNVGVLQIVVGLGIGSAAAMLWRARSREPVVRQEALLYLLPSLVALIFTLEVAMFLEYISHYRADTFDSFAYVVDLSFGAPVSFVIGRMFLAHPWLAAICTGIYLAPPPALIFVYALQVKRRPHPPVDIVTLLLLMGGAGYALYFLFPVAGPHFAFAGFPTHVPPTEGLVGHAIVIPPAPRNGVPSLHMASALIAYSWARAYGVRWRAVAAVFVVGTFLATMGVGEHYFFDLIVAMPFSVAMHALLVPGARRTRALCGIASAALFFFWLYVARFHAGDLLQHRALPFTLLLATLALYAATERRVTVASPRRDATQRDAVADSAIAAL